MNIITNDSLIKRNARIAQVTMVAGLVVLAGGMFVSIRFTDPRYFYLTLLALLFGFILSQVGIYFANHYSRRPRPDEQLNQALKGLDAKYTLYHYMTPIPHLLVGPAGVWVLMPRSQQGRITFTKGRWKQIGGNWYLKIFAQEGLGRPDVDLEAEIDKVKKHLATNLPEGSEIPTIRAALVFTNPKAVVDIPEDAEPPADTVLVKDLKEIVRKAGKGKSLSPAVVQQITAVFPAESK
jgi:hypothetical protein